MASLRVTAQPDQEPQTEDLGRIDHRAAAQHMLKWLSDNIDGDKITAVGHRVVHGGPNNSSGRLIDQVLINELQSLVNFDTEHLPLEISLINDLVSHLPKARHFACFDTAFHSELPAAAAMLPIPRRYYDQGLKRYGFHGLSYSYLLNQLGETYGQESKNGRVIMAHLGNGVSLCAARDGKSVDTSMSLTPAGGVPMSTRSGDLDPGLVAYLMRTENLDADRLNRLTAHESGLLGISETTSDMEKLLAISDQDNRAAEAVDVFCYQIKKQIGAYAAALGGLDTLIFSGGIGEKAPVIRARICDSLDFLGVKLDESRNMRNTDVISSDDSHVKIRVMPTNEELSMARDIINLTDT